MKMKTFLYVVAVSIFYSLVSSANNSGISYQGRIFKPDGSALESANVQFRMQVRSPGPENCLLYEEIQSLNMSSSIGVFSITLNDGTGTRVDTPTYQVDRIFANRDSMVLDSARCAVGTTYSPNVGDGRKFIVYFKDESMSQYEPLPTLNLNYAPLSMYALESQKLDKFGVNSVLRAVDGSGNPTTAMALDPAQLTNLSTLLAGTSTQYATSTQFNTVQAYAKVALPSCSTGEVLFSNGTTFSCVTDGGSAGGSEYSAITGATTTNSIDNTNFAQSWNWSTASTQNPMTMSADSLTTGSLLNLTTSSNSLNSTSGLLNISNSGTSTTGMIARIKSNSSASSGLTVLANGNVGIGVLAPASLLDVNGTSNFSGNMKVGGTLSTSARLEVSRGANSNYNPTGFPDLTVAIGNGFFNNNGAALIGFLTRSSTTTQYSWMGPVSGTGTAADLVFGMQDGVGGQSERLRIQGSSGNIGVGTTTPTVKMDVNGALRAGSSATVTTCGMGAANGEGSQRYNYTTHAMEYCNGTTWISLLSVQGTPPATAPATAGYFVMTSTMWNGALGGLAGADAKCLTELTTTNTSWSGYADANTRGILTASKVKALLCNESTCNNLIPSTTYYYAVSGDGAAGGAYFTTDSSGAGPNDSVSWAAANRFSGSYNFWSNRATGTATAFATTRNANSWASGCDYNGTSSVGYWQLATGGNASVGTTTNTNGLRWNNTTQSCNTTASLVCFVNP